MLHVISNEHLTVTVANHGAELQNITNNRTGQEYLWQGDAKFWGRRSPVLFPIVGSLNNNQTIINGKAYNMSQHGFARDMDFELESATETSLTFALESTAETLQRFPFPFRLEIIYTLDETRLEVQWNVSNKGSEVMPFQIGAHPAFNYPNFSAANAIHGYFAFGNSGEMLYELIEHGAVVNGKHQLATDSNGLLPLTDDTFKNDALIFDNNIIHRVSLLTEKHEPYISLLFNSPLVGLWSKTNPTAPFVCIEPWWGRCDRQGFAGEASEREHINLLNPTDIFTASYLIIIDNI
jgi:galactose mutarotase-like enzyme